MKNHYQSSIVHYPLLFGPLVEPSVSVVGFTRKRSDTAPSIPRSVNAVSSQYLNNSKTIKKVKMLIRLTPVTGYIWLYHIETCLDSIWDRLPWLPFKRCWESRRLKIQSVLEKYSSRSQPDKHLSHSFYSGVIY